MYIFRFNCQHVVFSSSSFVVVVPECEKSSATTYFWYRQTLNITSSIDDTGGLNWKMTVSLLVAWILVCLAVIKGIQSSGKVGSVSVFTTRTEPSKKTVVPGHRCFIHFSNLICLCLSLAHLW